MRDLHIDSLKGFLILAVLWGHVGVVAAGLTAADQSGWLLVEQYANWIWPVNYFHMPLFFALSVLFLKPLSLSFLKKRAALLLIPYVFWFLYPQRDILLTNPLVFDWIATLKNLVYANWAHVISILWFLPALFSVNIYYSIYRKYAHRKWTLSCFVVLFLITFIFAKSIAQTYHVSIPFGIDLAIYLFPYLFIIDTIYKKRERLTRHRVWYVLACLPIYAFSLFLITSFEPIKFFTDYHHRIDLAQFSVPFTVPGLLGMILLSCAILIFFLIIKPSRLLATLGQYSLPIYLLHLFIYARLVTLYNYFQLSNTIWLVVMIFLSVPLAAGCAILLSKLYMKISSYAKYIGMV